MAAMMGLAKELVNYLQDVNKNYDSKLENAVKVVEGFIPDTSSATIMREICPRIIVRPYQMTDKDVDMASGTAEIKVVITFLTYAETDDDGYKLLYNWIEKNRRELLSIQKLGAYHMTRPMTTFILDEAQQPRPMWAGYIEATYETVSIEEEGLLEDDYGYEI